MCNINYHMVWSVKYRRKVLSTDVEKYLKELAQQIAMDTVVIGDITGIREDNDQGSVENQKMHSLPYAKIYTLLEYKLAQGGITLVKQQEAYSSQTSPLKESVCKENAEKSNRVKRGLYKDGNYYWNADCVGAFNILRLYFQATGIATKMDPQYIASPHVAKVAV